MTSVNMPRDDAANRIDSKAVADRSVKAIDGYPRTQAVKPHEDVTLAPQQQTPRKRSQRRKQERRKKRQPVLLDTRSGRDRRNAAQAGNVSVEGDTAKGEKTGIDVYT